MAFAHASDNCTTSQQPLPIFSHINTGKITLETIAADTASSTKTQIKIDGQELGRAYHKHSNSKEAKTTRQRARALVQDAVNKAQQVAKSTTTSRINTSQTPAGPRSQKPAERKSCAHPTFPTKPRHAQQQQTINKTNSNNPKEQQDAYNRCP